MSLEQPTPPDPTATANAQEGLNKQSAIYQAEMNNVNQTTPYGSLTYSQTGTNPDGTPIYSSTTSLNPAEQQLFNTDVGTQQQMASDASTLAGNLGNSLTSAPNLSNPALVNEMMGWQQQYMQPIFNQQQSNLNSQLAAQGITQGSDAYNNAQNLQSRNVNNAYESALANDEGQAFNQAAEAYQLPIQTLGTLLGESQPGSVAQNLVQTPQEQIQPANYESLAEQQYAQQNSIYANTMSGIFGIGDALAGGWAKSSDRRLKSDIARVGYLDDGTPIYRFRHVDDGRMEIGLMAQDIVGRCPEAIHLDDHGFMMVDYKKATERAARHANG